MPEDTVTATGYLTVRAKRRSWASNGKYPIQAAKIMNARQGKPDKLDGDEVVIKVSVQLPKKAFEPLEPEALIVVPEELIQHVVEVEAVPDEA